MGWIPEWVAGSVLSGCPLAHLISLGGKSRNLGIFILYRFLWRKENVFIIKINKAWWKQLPKTHHLHWWRQLFFSGEIAMLSFGFGNYYYYFLFRIYRVYRKILTELAYFPLIEVKWQQTREYQQVIIYHTIMYVYSVHSCLSIWSIRR